VKHKHKHLCSDKLLYFGKFVLEFCVITQVPKVLVGCVVDGEDLVAHIEGGTQADGFRE
jgi:hypothetical protein